MIIVQRPQWVFCNCLPDHISEKEQICSSMLKVALFALGWTQPEALLWRRPAWEGPIPICRWCALIPQFAGMTRRFLLSLRSFSSPETAQPRLWSGSCLFYALLELFSKFPPTKAAWSQEDEEDIMVMTGRDSSHLAFRSWLWWEKNQTSLYADWGEDNWSIMMCKIAAV